MANIIIYQKDGEPIPSSELDFKITKAEQNIKLFADNVLNVEIQSNKVLPLAIGCYIEYCGEIYTLNQLPTVVKNSSVNFTSTMQFESIQYELLDCAWLLPADTYGDSFTGNLESFLNILIENTQRNTKTWRVEYMVGDVDFMKEYKTLTYTQTNCLNVLQNLCKEFGFEYKFVLDGDERVIEIYETIGDTFPARFRYGQSGGAYKIERKTTNNKNVITKLFVFGSDKNLPTGYRENKLCLPNASRNLSYITDAEAQAYYGIKESVKYFTDIYPQRYGKITSLVPNSSASHAQYDYNAFYDSSMDFDLNETDENGDTKWLIDGTTAKIQMVTGNLAGYQFELKKFYRQYGRSGLPAFFVKTYTDANGLKFPNPNSAAFQFQVEDEYFITDIRLPNSYVTSAENKLKDEGQKYFDAYCKPQVSYAISIDNFFLQALYGETRIEQTIFKTGDYIEVYDTDLEILKKLRISQFTRNLLNPYEFTVNISDNVEITSTFQRIVSDIADIKNIITINDKTSTDNARRNWMATQEVLNAVFDPEGNYYSEKIKPASIETTMLAVGARSQQFTLKNLTIEPNYGGNTAVVHNTSGVLEHYTIEAPDVRTWNLGEKTAANLQANSVYYIYAKCQITGNSGEIIYDTAQHIVDEDETYYYFLIGTLTSEIYDSENDRAARNVALTYGASTINGRFIKTGRIQSADGNTYMDLDNGIFGGTFYFKDGLISETVMVGDSTDNAKAGISGEITTPGFNLFEGSQFFNTDFSIENSATKVDYNFDNVFTTVQQSAGKSAFSVNGVYLNTNDEIATLSFYARGVSNNSKFTVIAMDYPYRTNDREISFFPTTEWKQYVIKLENNIVDQDFYTEFKFYVDSGNVIFAAVCLRADEESAEWRLSSSESGQTISDGKDIPIRYWSGAAHKYAAPFKVLANGDAISGGYWKYAKLASDGTIQIRNQNNNIVGFFNGGGDIVRPDNLGVISMFMSVIGKTSSEFFSGNDNDKIGAIAAYTEYNDGIGIAKFYADCYEGREMVLDNRGGSHHDTSLQVITRTGQDTGISIENRGKNSVGLYISNPNNYKNPPFAYYAGGSFMAGLDYDGYFELPCFCVLQKVLSYTDLTPGNTEGGETFWKKVLKEILTYTPNRECIVIGLARPNSLWCFFGARYAGETDGYPTFSQFVAFSAVGGYNTPTFFGTNNGVPKFK